MKNLPDLELLSAYLDGELTADQQAHVERLLAASAEARQLLEDLRTVSQSLQGLPVYKLTEDLTPRILQEAQRRKQSALPASTAPTLTDRPATASEQGVGGLAPHVESTRSPALAGPPVPQAVSRAMPQPTDGWQVPGAAVGRNRPGFGGRTVFRRLFTSRGIVWSATAVAVAVLLWWFGPPMGPRIPEVARAPKAPDHLGEKGDSEGRTGKGIQNGWAGGVGRSEPSGAAIRARTPPSKAPSAEMREKTSGSSDPLAAAQEPSADRALSPGPESSLMAFRRSLPKAPPLGPIMAQPPLEEKTEKTSELKGRKALEASPSPSALDEAVKLLAMGKGYGAGPARSEAPALGSRTSGAPSPAAVAAAQNAAGERENRIGGALGTPPAPGGVGRPSAGAGASPVAGIPEKLAAESQGKQDIGDASELAMAAKPTPPPSEGGASAVSAIPKKQSTLFSSPEGLEEDSQDSAPLIPDTTMVVVCDLSGLALRQRSFEQILSSQQIAIQEGEEVLEELAALGRDKQARTDGEMRGDGSPSSKPAPSEIVGAQERNKEGANAPLAPPVEVLAAPPSPSHQIAPMEKKVAKTQTSADQRVGMPPRSGELPAQGGGFGPGLPEHQLQFVLVEASQEQLEGTLKAMQDRPEEFLAVSVAPAPSDPAQQIYQQYTRAYRARSSLADQAPMGQSPVGRSQRAPEKNASPSHKAPSAGASQGPELAKPRAVLESTKERTLQESPPLTDAPQAGSRGTALGRQDQQIFGQQARARRLRLPEHLSQQFSLVPQQAGQSLEQLQRQAPADAPTPPSPAETSSTEPDRSQPAMAPEPAPAKMDAAKAEQKSQTSQDFSRSFPGVTDGSGVRQAQQTPQMIRVLFVLRPAEAAP